ncbi:hypothetical protein GGP69_003175 [Salinibacter ruber]|nr:hypothetical protein [Salinibacter ruber]
MGGAYSLSFTVLAPDAPDELRIEATEQRFSDATMTVGFSESIGQDIALSSIEISTIDELQAIQTDSDFPLDGYYKQTADIDASGFGSFQPIGDEIVPFSGTFDGKKFAISNLNIENEGEPNSFFRFISEDGVLKDVRLKGVKVNAASNGPAGLVGVNRGLIESIYLKGIIIGDLISVGGVVSKNYGVIKSVEANVTVEGAFDTGGLVSFNSGMIRDAHVTGEISGGNNIGGVVGRNGGSGTVMNSSSSVNISSNTDNMGGIAGESGGKIESCFSNSTLSGKSSVGGVVGLIEGGEVSNSYSIGSIDGNSEVGGLAGTNNDGEISKSFAAGDISGSSDVGGLTGVNGGTLSSTVWDTEASSQSSGVGRGDAAGTTGLTTSEMQGNSAEENMDGFDFQNTWQVVIGDYPALQWEE